MKENVSKCPTSESTLECRTGFGNPPQNVLLKIPFLDYHVKRFFKASDGSPKIIRAFLSEDQEENRKQKQEALCSYHPSTETKDFLWR
jgi:hypothetical protein